MKAKWRRTKEYRLWRIKVIRRDTKCVICGSRDNREAHHVANGAHHPELRLKLIMALHYVVNATQPSIRIISIVSERKPQLKIGLTSVNLLSI